MRVLIITKEHLIRAGIALAVVLVAVVIIQAFRPGAKSVFAPKDNIPIYSVNTKNMQVAITFDAAWGTDKTIAILDALDAANVKATFFVTGMWANKNADMLREIAKRGHEIGSHGYTHKDLTTLPEPDVLDELKKTDDSIEKITGKRPVIFRAPYGAWNAKLVDIVGKYGVGFIQWDVDSLDWKGLDTAAIENRIFSKVQSGSIMLYHNDAAHTYEALPDLLSKLKEKGYKPVTISELVEEGLEASNSSK